VGREGGRQEGRRELERLGVLPRVLQAKGFIEHNMPRTKRE
jgi:hypothetical protein